MRKINHIVVHCSATKAGKDFDVNDIRRWHKQRGWSDVGYHYVIKLDGTVQKGRSVERTGAHVRGHNKDTIGVCLIGGLDKNGDPAANFTQAQLNALRVLLLSLKEKYARADILGHRDFPGVHKACPCFNVRRWWRTGECA